MTASSDERSRVLAKIETKQIQTLLAVISRATMIGSKFIEAAFKKQARHFPETLSFVKDLQWVKERRGELSLTIEGGIAANSTRDDVEIRKRICESVIADGSPYQRLIADYLAQFKPTESGLVHRPPISNRLLESSVRNLLMDIRIVAYVTADDLYTIMGDSTELYVWAANHRLPTSRVSWETNAKRKEKLGLAAEIAILEYEKKRVGTPWNSNVEHVSAKIPFSSYDIKSVTLNNAVATSRYIEVKAVAADSYQFFWTSSEVGAARLLRAKYFLYLLPVGGRAGFDLEKLLIIENPIAAIYENAKDWLIEEDVIICTQKR